MLNSPNPGEPKTRTVAILNHRGERLVELRSGLQDLGWQVITSRDLETSLEILREQKPQAAIVAPLTLRAENLEWQRLLDPLSSIAWLVLPWESAPASVTSALFRDHRSTGDWIEFPFDSLKANLRLGNLLMRRQELEVLAARSKRLEERLKEDDKSTLGNNLHYNECLEREFERTRRNKSPLSLIFMDICGFKQVNEKYGHEFGDFVLRNVGNRVREALRTSDIPVRFGGDEFKLLLPDTPAPAAIIASKRLIKALARKPVEQGDISYTIHCYFGISTYSGDGETTKAQFNSQADQSVISAKKLGRDAIAFWDPKTNGPSPRAKSKGKVSTSKDEAESEPEGKPKRVS